MEITILDAGTTDGVQSKSFAVEGGKVTTVALFPEANIGSDTAVLCRIAPDGTLVKCRDKDGIVTMGGGRPQEVVFGPGPYVLTVATRTASWGISINAD